MKKTLYFIVLWAMVFQPGLGLGFLDVKITQDSVNRVESPGWPMPAKPIPHHDVGHLSNASSYNTQVQATNEIGVLETASISGLDAYVADGLDPLAGNYTLVNSDKVLRSGLINGGAVLQPGYPLGSYARGNLCALRQPI